MTSGAVTTTNANDLLYGFGASNGAVTAAGAGFTTRSLTFGNIAEDRTVTREGLLRRDRDPELERLGDAVGRVQSRGHHPALRARRPRPRRPDRARR